MFPNKYAQWFYNNFTCSINKCERESWSFGTPTYPQDTDSLEWCELDVWLPNTKIDHRGRNLWTWRMITSCFTVSVKSNSLKWRETTRKQTALVTWIILTLLVALDRSTVSFSARSTARPAELRWKLFCDWRTFRKLEPLPSTKSCFQRSPYTFLLKREWVGLESVTETLQTVT